MYVYTQTYVHLYYININVFTFIHTHTQTHSHAHTSTRICTYVHTHGDTQTRLRVHKHRHGPHSPNTSGKVSKHLRQTRQLKSSNISPLIRSDKCLAIWSRYHSASEQLRYANGTEKSRQEERSHRAVTAFYLIEPPLLRWNQAFAHYPASPSPQLAPPPRYSIHPGDAGGAMQARGDWPGVATRTQRRTHFTRLAQNITALSC